jgi:hypothetical protein
MQSHRMMQSQAHHMGIAQARPARDCQSNGDGIILATAGQNSSFVSRLGFLPSGEKDVETELMEVVSASCSASTSYKNTLPALETVCGPTRLGIRTDGWGYPPTDQPTCTPNDVCKTGRCEIALPDDDHRCN